jgi:hypothetical protein
MAWSFSVIGRELSERYLMPSIAEPKADSHAIPKVTCSRHSSTCGAYPKDSSKEFWKSFDLAAYLKTSNPYISRV